ncbi:MAG: hypothetical protein K2V38_02365 [Gemmataceae bacterium]|nr:hypothetical protein [Gemmataceae bacterium]
MPVYFVYYATIETSIPHLVVCENCKTEYIYELKRGATGESSGGPETAKKKAWTSLLNQLLNACDPVPCMECLHYQDHMRETAAKRKYVWLEHLASISAVTAFFALVVLAIGWYIIRQEPEKNSQFYEITGAITGISAILAIVLYCLSSYLCARYDPNATREEVRRQIAVKRAMTVKGYRDKLAARMRVGYEKHLTEMAKKRRSERSDFVIEVWLKEEELTGKSPIVVSLPDGATAQLYLGPDMEDGSDYPLESDAGKRLPFVARVSRFRTQATANTEA